MKKVIIYSVIFFVVGAVLSPVIGMAIGETRNLILGLAPEESVLELADKIDQNKEDNENKMQEMQTLIEQQKATIDEQTQKLSQAEGSIESQKSQIANVQAEAVKSRDCSADVNQYCVSDSFYTKEKFDKYMERYEDFGKKEYEKYKEKYTKVFNDCQQALACK
ncbi:MAG: hypothetical protein ACD_7C00020G0032 [uncultured bacterium]|nr:MAG: hypothetical protein ACD_7C00020G0032 [uncultured bacterium]KKP67780.1 MAG: hypothetical protein UR66_C0010G0018 [Candidatus Moranbacteria bacterium GW2011_GWE1_35_17]KKP67837.1 MAG: hypothetical protein UR65_C0065G0003 [Candidatus Moranbacteria bacterium GW2011_GWE2_35_164]KKP83213.1 MAG: hypothetical protein UR83_C0038G0016 [Candidatus Moranbacteria bacterium GW2011_GWF2_35_54]KKP83686.1 MAG: hypothetical protein UR82_C0019G0014 [Candidatus Moranbacteria bacterium GW2011_GWF1_35_5]HB